MGAAERAYDERIAPHLNEFFGNVFEEICMQYLKLLVTRGTIKELYAEYGRWWGANPLKKREEEIDLVLSNEKHLLVGECKWQKAPLSPSVLQLLEERAAIIRDGKKLHYVLFSKSGFTDELQSLHRDDLTLVDIEQLLCKIQ